MMATAATIFVYYTTWAILVVGISSPTTTLTLKLSSHSLMRRVRYTRGFPHVNGQCAFLPSFSFWGYLPLEHSSVRLLFEKIGRRHRKPSFEPHDTPLWSLVLYSLHDGNTY
jgi:hypothetical protein